MADAAPEVQIAEEFTVIIIFNIVVIAQLAQADIVFVQLRQQQS